MVRNGRFRVEGTWLRSRLARRIFLMFFVMAFVPSALVFWLTWRQADRAIDASEHRNVRAETRFIAFTLLSRLQSADALLATIADAGGAATPGAARVFDAVSTRTAQPGIDLSSVSRLQVLAQPGSPVNRVVLLAVRRGADGSDVVYAGALDPDYFWRPGEDVVEGTRVCVRADARLLGCAGGVSQGARTLRDTWELDLHEFRAPAWRFEAQRESAATPAVQLHIFATLAAAVLLMSMMQIRRTLVPLEALMDRIRLFSGSGRPGARHPVPDELAALSFTFDEMRERIGGQMAHLHGMSAVDTRIVSRAPLDVVLVCVATQLRALPGIEDAAVVMEASNDEARIAYCAEPAGGVFDADCLLRLVSSPVSETPDGYWHRCAPVDGARAVAGARAYRLAVGGPGEPHAWVLVQATSPAGLDVDVLDPARQLADRVAIALALDARERRLVHQSRHDALTGLPNRLAATEALDAAIESSGPPFAVVFMDLDRFKAVNDGLGHALGDGLLTEVARRLRCAVPAADVVARFGGDEFVLLLHGVPHMGALDAIRLQIDSAFAKPVVLGDHVMAIRYSAGVAFHPADGDTAHELVRKADVAMYRAKQDGGGRFAAYSAGMNEAAREEVELVAALRVALAEDALDVHFQPRIEASTGRWEGMEALVRWHDVERGWVPPSRFVPLAERHGLIDPLGSFVLRATCRRIAAWRELGLVPGRVAVNVSSDQLRAGTLADEIARVLAETGARWSDLEVEITESLLISDVDTSALQLQALRDLGVTVAIDDFGTGYSSLAYLARLPLDTIKIDRAFVVALDEPGTAPVVRAVLALAAALDKRVVTEGVETLAQLRVLQGWGCDVFQGYLFHRPMPADDIQRLLEARVLAAGSAG